MVVILVVGLLGGMETYNNFGGQDVWAAGGRAGAGENGGNADVSGLLTTSGGQGGDGLISSSPFGITLYGGGGGGGRGSIWDPTGADRHRGQWAWRARMLQSTLTSSPQPSPLVLPILVGEVAELLRSSDVAAVPMAGADGGSGIVINCISNNLHSINKTSVFEATILDTIIIIQ